jgi:hypothetical protein
MILLIAFAMWWLLFERLYYLLREHPRRARRSQGRMGGAAGPPQLVCGKYRNELVGRRASD